MRLSVNPNRMELIKLRRRLAVARRGHKLLKDKLDELIRQFLGIVKEHYGLRQDFEEKLIYAHEIFAIARGEISTKALEEALLYPHATISVEVATRNVMNVIVPEFHLKQEGTYDCYSLNTTPAVLDEALEYLNNLVPLMVKLAETEKRIKLLASEIERTRRRVNALEYVIIPQIEETINFITMKLDEMERSSQTRLLRIKTILGESMI